MFIGSFYRHVISAIIGLGISYLLIIIFIHYNEIKINKSTKIIKGEKTSIKGLLGNLTISENDEIQLIGSLKDKNGVTFIGSSELDSVSPYSPCNFLTDSFNIRFNSFGHAFQQSFAVLCQLLALKEYIPNSKICFIISPGWFETEGTNMEAFVTFAKPNFLKRIIKDETIPLVYKIAIGKYLHNNYNLIENPNNEIDYFINIYKFHDIPILNTYLYNKNNEFENVKYKITKNATTDFNLKKIKWDLIKDSLQNNFVSNIKTNKCFIRDDYYKEYILRKDGTVKKGKFYRMYEFSNQELKDFELLINFLKENNVNASFMIQALNPYHIEHLDRFNPILNRIIDKLNKAKFPFINQFVDNKNDYKPGTLIDIMHTGDFGWMDINKFILNTYYE